MLNLLIPQRCANLSSSITLRCRSSLLPVSYTHLDVYKRQLSLWSSGFSPSARLSSPLFNIRFTSSSVGLQAVSHATISPLKMCIRDRGSSGEYCTMGASLMQPCRVYEEGLRVVKYFQRAGHFCAIELHPTHAEDRQYRNRQHDDCLLYTSRCV